MSRLDTHLEIGHLVAEKPARSRVFDRHGIDYCCSGKRTIDDACRDGGIDATTVLAELEALDTHDSANEVDPGQMTLTELIDHIEHTHHVFLRSELPRLKALVDKVAAVHGTSYPWLEDVAETFADLVAELGPHMLKEEQILFPMIRELDRVAGSPSSRGGSIGDAIRAMEHEHHSAGLALSRLRTLTTDFTAPEGACNTLRAMVDGLAALEADTHQHIHKENNVLFVRASEVEQELRA